MKIVRIIARLNIGGPARNAVLLAQGFSRPLTLTLSPKGRGDFDWETVLVCGEVSENEGDMMYLAREKGIEPVVVSELGRELSFWNDWKAFWKIYRIICRERPDIIHTHTAKAGALGRMGGVLYNFSSWLMAHGSREKCYLVHTFHGHVLHSYFGKIKTWFFIWIEKFLTLFTDRIIAVSEVLKKELVEKYRITPEGKISVVELGFELDELFKLPLRENNGIVKIGIIGRLAPIKNHRMLFRVLKKLTAYSLQLTAVVIGDGELRQELERYKEELKLGDIVEFKGWVKDLAEIYRNLDIVVLTSLNEGTPVSIIEAMAAARSVVATDVGGVADIMQDGKSGYLVALGDEKGFAKRLADLIRYPEKREMFGIYGRESVKERFSKERLIRDMNRVYNKYLKNEGAKR